MNMKVVCLVLVLGSPMAALAETGSVAEYPSLCDLNHDFHVDAVDVQTVINGALGLVVTVDTTDVNGDGVTDAVDVQAVINMALSGRLPEIEFVGLTPFGSPDGQIFGNVWLRNSQDYKNLRVALFARVKNTDQFVLLSPADTLTAIDPIVGDWAEAANVDPGRDSTCREFLAYLVPTWHITEVPASSMGEPSIIWATDMVRAFRKPQVTLTVAPTITDGVNGHTNCDYRYFGVICYTQYGQENGSRVYPQPLSNPTGSNALASINSDGTFHVALDQTSLGPVVTDYDPSKAVTVLTQVVPHDTDYVDAWPEFVNNLGLNFYDQVAQIQAPIVR